MVDRGTFGNPGAVSRSLDLLKSPRSSGAASGGGTPRAPKSGTTLRGLSLKAKNMARLGYHSEALHRSCDRLIEYVRNGFHGTTAKGRT
jgi:hypothetical protein